MANEQTSVPLYAASEILTAANMNISAGTGVPVFATTATRDAAFGGANEKVLAEGQLCYLSASNIVQYYDGAAWATVGPGTNLSYAIFNESQASGTDGGTFTSGSYVKRTLNTTVVNTITGCSIASSVITLPAGTYQVLATAPAYFTNENKAKLRNTTAGTDIALGQSSYAGSSSTVSSMVQTYFTLAGSTLIELQHRASATRAGNGLGTSCSYGDSEIYSQITIVKVA